jgi:uncharacterized repeat protein (TIGR01451 family)
MEISPVICASQSFLKSSRYPVTVALTCIQVIGLQAIVPVAVIAQDNSPPLRPAINNQADYEYTNARTNHLYRGTTGIILTKLDRLVDPLGRIVGCNGGLLPDYTGFSVGLYELNSADPTGTELGNLVRLTPTELPDVQNNGVPGGLAPNITNQNPYQLSNNQPANLRGVYNFLFDPNQGQTQVGRSYILVVNPPRNSIYQQRRVKIQIVDSTGGIGNNIVRYLATSLDGQPISATGDTTVEDNIAFVTNAETVGLDLLALEFSLQMCQPDQIQIVKAADRTTTEPGSSAIYRLSIRNRGDAALQNIDVTDILPVGFKLLPNSVRGEIDNQIVPVTTDVNGNTLRFRTTAAVPTSRVLNIAYAMQVTSDAIRGTGRNSAVVTAERSDNRFRLKDGPATHHMKVRSGLLTDAGVIIGRVFDDRNFDGEQQPNEPGIPNAVIFLDDGNRITTDTKGLFSVSNVLSGYRTGVLDLTSIPGYQLAIQQPLKSNQANQSRLVKLAPSGLVRMNFAVMPVSASVVAAPVEPVVAPPAIDRSEFSGSPKIGG